MSTHFNFKQTVWHDETPTCWVNPYNPAEAYLHVIYGPLDLSFHEPKDVRALIDTLTKGLAEMEQVRAKAVAGQAAEDDGEAGQ